MVWSPLSNLLLYGQTANVAAAAAAGVPIALGSDWSPSGSKNLLGELKIARIVSGQAGNAFSAEALVRMVTSNPSELLGWQGQVGSIQRGKKADLLVVEGNSGDPFDLLIDSQEDDVLAVLIDGRPRHGRLGLLDFDPAKQERIVIGDKDYSLDLTEPGSDPLAGLSLATAIAKLTYGLANLPDLAAQALSPAGIAFEKVQSQARTIDFEMEEERDFGSLQSFALAVAPKLKPLAMAPITAVDDAQFIPTLKASRNLPAYVRNAL